MTEIKMAPAAKILDQDWRNIFRWGAICAITLVFISLVGMPAKLNLRLIINPTLSLGYVSLFWIPVMFGFVASTHIALEGMEVSRPGIRDVVTGLVTGLIGSFGLVLLILGMDNFDITDPLVNWGPNLLDLLTTGRGVGTGILGWMAASAFLGMAGASLHVLTPLLRRIVSSAILGMISIAILEDAIDDLSEGFRLEWLVDLVYAKRGGLTNKSAIIVAILMAAVSVLSKGRIKKAKANFRALDEVQRKKKSMVLFALATAAVVILPMFAGGYVNSLLANVGIFLLLALGLNIVVGLAGILDLGYVAFFAVGGYATAVLTSSQSPWFAPEIGFVPAMLISVVLAGITGLVIGAPVIRMRGDYLAIVTLGFGEIIRLLFMSDFLKPYFGGAQGITNVPGVELGFLTISGTDPKGVFYLVLVFSALAVYISWRLQPSRLGRSWMAIREDEQVAEAMGINTVNSKLMAFVVGAILASFAGSVMVARVGSVFPNSFMILVSIIILVVVIVGGMGSIPGVFVGSFVLIGVLGGPRQPGLLQEFGQLKLLIYGALLVFMMLKRPEGLVPSARRSQELHQDEFLQDAWFKGDDEAEGSDEQTTSAEGEGASV